MRQLLLILMVLIGFGVLGQTGPGGVGNSTSNEIWLMADSGVYNNAGTTLATNNDNVQEWHDVSGNGNDAIQNTSTFRPQYQTNQANGFPGIDFDGDVANNDRLLCAGVSTSDEATVFAVVRADAFSNNNDGVIHAAPSGSSFSTSGSNKSIGMWIERATSEPWGRGVQSNNSSRSIPSVTSISTGSFYVLTNDYDGSDITQYINGATAGSISYNGTLKSWTDFGIGRQGNETFTGDISEIIAYRVTLNAAQVIIVQNYLKAKYGITLTSNNIYTMDTPANGDYDFEVAGIGRASSGAITHTDSRGTSIVRISKSGGGLGNNEYLFWGHDNGVLNSFGQTDVPSSVQARLGRKWRVSEQGEVGNIHFDFDLTNLGSVTVTDLRLLIDSDGDGDFSDATSYSGASDQGGNVYRFTTSGNNVVENGYGFTIATINTTQTPLPITLSKFECVVEGDVVNISWTTNSEVNNERFEIERSTDLKNWNSIHYENGAGNSNKELHYSHIDASPIEGVSYYKLKQTDFDGLFSYSNIEVVNMNSSVKMETRVFPNPVYGELVNIKIGASEKQMNKLSVIDSEGKIVGEYGLEGSNGLIQISTPGIPGLYFLKFSSPSRSWVEKILVK